LVGATAARSRAESAAARQAEVADVQGYAPGGARSTLGDILKSKLGDLTLKSEDAAGPPLRAPRRGLEGLTEEPRSAITSARPTSVEVREPSLRLRRKDRHRAGATVPVSE